MFKRFNPLIRAFGVADGIRFYLHLLFKKYGRFPSSRYGQVFHLRKNFSDKYTFTQVFLDDQYGLQLTFEPRTIIDGGANIGLSSAYFAHRYPEASIVSIEPSSGNFQMLLKNTDSLKRVQGLNKGIWNRDALLSITNTSDHDNAFMVTEAGDTDQNTFPAVSIGSIMKDKGWEYIDILKLDIEGSEKEVFESGYEQWLPKTRVIIIELHDHMRKGASRAVFQAIALYPFSVSMKHENLVFINEAFNQADFHHQ